MTSDVPIFQKVTDPISDPITIFFFFWYFPIRGSLSRTICCNPFWNRRKIEKVVFLKKSQKSWKSSEWLELPNSDFKGCFSLFVPKVVFFLYFKTCSFRLCQQKKSIIWRYIAKLISRSPLKGMPSFSYGQKWQKWVFWYSGRKVHEISLKMKKSPKKPKKTQKSLFGTPGVAR